MFEALLLQRKLFYYEFEIMTYHKAKSLIAMQFLTFVKKFRSV